METRTPKLGWTPKGIIGLVFTPVGAFLVALGLGIGLTLDDGEERLAILLSLGVQGLIFLVAGLVLLYLDLHRRKRQLAAYESGNCVRATVTGIVSQSRGRAAGSVPYVLEVHWTDPDTGILHVYYSRSLFVSLPDLVGTEIPLYLDRDDPDTGFVDVDAVLPDIRVHRG